MSYELQGARRSNETARMQVYVLFGYMGEKNGELGRRELDSLQKICTPLQDEDFYILTFCLG